MKSPIHDLIDEHYKANYDILCRHCMRRAGNMYNAEDVVQEAYSEALRFGYSFDPDRAVFDTWFGTILNHAIIRFRRAENNYGMSYETDVENEPESTLSGYEQRLLEDLSKDMTSRSNKEHSSILYLHFMREFKVGEIAKTLDVPLTQVKKVILRYKQEVKHQYGQLHTDTTGPATS